VKSQIRSFILITITGKYTNAYVYSNDLEEYAAAQIQMLCNQEVLKDSRIRIMPDVHPGKVGPIGLTMTVKDAVLPSLVGIDIGCGISIAKLKNAKIDGKKLDRIIRENVENSPRKKDYDFTNLLSEKHIEKDRVLSSFGTLGSGNHFIEIDQDDEGCYYLTVHSGSRHLGKNVADFYMKEGSLEIKRQQLEIPYELTFLKGQLLDDYLQDLSFTCLFAKNNRAEIIHSILKGMKWKSDEECDCPHNYIDNSQETLQNFGYPMLHKGSISAKIGEKVIIPINMKDGILLGSGLGNLEWNCSAPHGSGRVKSRTEIKESSTVSAFKKEMQGIYCSCINQNTLDEAPFAYRRKNEFIPLLADTISLTKQLHPVYSYKKFS